MKKIAGILMLSLALGSCQDLVKWKKKETEQVSVEKASEKEEEKEKSRIVESYDKDGNLYSRISFKGEEKHGPGYVYYRTGEVNRKVQYSHGIKTDTSYWYYKDGTVYRATPYMEGKIHGIQKKYYDDGSLRAEIPYKNGFRVYGLKEINAAGYPVNNYPDIVVNTQDMRAMNSTFLIKVKLSNGSSKVKFYIGNTPEGVIDTDRLFDISSGKGKGQISYYEKDGHKGAREVQVIAEYKTRGGNKKYIIKKVKLPAANLTY